MIRHTFKKSERLTNKKTFDLLFKSGKSISVFPFRLVWIETKKDVRMEIYQPSNPPTFQCLVAISVPKKSFPKAVHRNTIKRRIREAYRKNKHLLYEVLQNKNHSVALMIIYTAKEQLLYREIEQKMVVSLRLLTTNL